ncbi:hypothetical protein QAD02_013017 [Eretmocerus hayati]|uniref:Uncharacterized protein n=1 Tax=Eretmocerus hayati TaxID=131215 RepID=A0ACC2P0Y8_9HYME|nr:hypothetical protein QAD02_013017 [Eretmocerus hayati]
MPPVVVVFLLQFTNLCTPRSCQFISEDCEQVYAVVTFLSNKKLFIGCTYLPPASSPSIYKEHISAVHQLSGVHGDCDWIVLGDFNVPGINWFNMPNLEYEFVSKSARNAVCADIIRNGYSFMNMKQYFPVPDNKSYSLDLFFSNMSNISSFVAPKNFINS